MKYKVFVNSVDYHEDYTQFLGEYDSFKEAKTRLNTLKRQMQDHILEVGYKNWKQYKDFGPYLEVFKKNSYIFIDEIEAVRYYIEKHET